MAPRFVVVIHLYKIVELMRKFNAVVEDENLVWI